MSFFSFNMILKKITKDKFLPFQLENNMISTKKIYLPWLNSLIFFSKKLLMLPLMTKYFKIFSTFFLQDLVSICWQRKWSHLQRSTVEKTFWRKIYWSHMFEKVFEYFLPKLEKSVVYSHRLRHFLLFKEKKFLN